jgi:DNA-binding MurR/RpiR family transcriptional regulator
VEFPSLRTPLDRWEDEVGGLASTGDPALVEQVRLQAYANLDKTFEQLDPRAIGTALDLLLQAKRAIIAGGGSSRALAMQLQRVLQVAQVPSQLIDDWFGYLFDGASFSATDVLFAVTTWKYGKVTIEALRSANAAGARTILLTDAQFAPGTDVADVVLLFSPQAIGELASPMAGAAVIDCLAAGFAARVPDRVKASLGHVAGVSAAHGLVYD